MNMLVFLPILKECAYSLLFIVGLFLLMKTQSISTNVEVPGVRVCSTIIGPPTEGRYRQNEPQWHILESTDLLKPIKVLMWGKVIVHVPGSMFEADFILNLYTHKCTEAGMLFFFYLFPSKRVFFFCINAHQISLRPCAAPYLTLSLRSLIWLCIKTTELHIFSFELYNLDRSKLPLLLWSFYLPGVLD